eukprot:364472-Chlamydomonas_euryale.AAC.4
MQLPSRVVWVQFPSRAVWMQLPSRVVWMQFPSRALAPAFLIQCVTTASFTCGGCSLPHTTVWMQPLTPRCRRSLPGTRDECSLPHTAVWIQRPCSNTPLNAPCSSANRAPVTADSSSHARPRPDPTSLSRQPCTSHTTCALCASHVTRRTSYAPQSKVPLHHKVWAQLP